MMKLVLVRHGESEWNLQNRFTGWVDVDLTEKGISEAKAAGKTLKELGYIFDVAFTSFQKRAIKTLNYILEEIDQLYIPVYKSWRLNERHYGALQGLNKAETAKKYGDEQVHIWRRSFDIAPPLINIDDKENYPLFQERYKNIPVDECPRGESLKDTIHRVLPYWDSHISKEIKEGKNVIIAAHGNSLRALIQYLLKIDNTKILELNLPTGKPLIFEINENLEILSAPELF
nr:2,3-diphosphoglycerate-dependent phosphoglycerate mutase [Pseudoleptotrichia goodfellowii]